MNIIISNLKNASRVSWVSNTTDIVIFNDISKVTDLIPINEWRCCSSNENNIKIVFVIGMPRPTLIFFQHQ